MITSIKIDNFKSLVGFDLPLTKFNCLIGLNSSGKSTVLQAIDFLSRLMIGGVDEWLELRHWSSADLNSKLTNKSNIDFEVIIDDPGWGEIVWSGSINRTDLRCTREEVRLVRLNNAKILMVDSGSCSIFPLRGIEQLLESKGFEEALRPERFPIVFKYTGSVISQLRKEQISLPLQVLKDHLIQVKSLDLISPAAMKKRSRASDRDMGLGGEKLSAFLHELDSSKQKKLLEMLGRLYPRLKDIKTSSLQAGWKQLSISESYGDRILKTEARHINDGMLRLMAILAQISTEHSVLLFDEIENGINSELVEQLLDWLVEAPQQILVTTHSPMILNYLEDDVARAGVQYLYKTPEGYTRSIPFFSIPSLAHKLEVMGPGEAFVDTELSLLPEEISHIEKSEQETGDAPSTEW
jgi:ABC-type multidrug transport system ATPase subunit